MRTILIPLIVLAFPCWGQVVPHADRVEQSSKGCAFYAISSITHGAKVKLTWASPACELAGVRIFRRVQGIGVESEIHPVSMFGNRNDTTFVTCLDTLFTELNVYEYRVVPLDSLGTEGPSSAWAIGTNLHKDVAPRLLSARVKEIPNERSLRLQWNIVYPERVRGIVIYRAEEYDGPYEHLVDVDPADSAYIDRVQRVKETYFYRIELIDVVGISSMSIPLLGLSDTEPIVSPPVGVVAEAEPHGVMLYWLPGGPDVSHYKVEQSVPGDENWVLVADGIRTPAEGHVQWMDSSATDNKVRRYRVRAISIGGPISDPSEEETIQAADSSVPSTPTDVVVRRVDDHAVVISWSDIWSGDLGMFKANVERADTGSTEFKVLNAAPLNRGVTLYYDSTAILGKPYTYRVVGLTVAGTRGIPSIPAVLKVKDRLATGPSMLLAHREAEGISLQWPARERQGTGFNLYRALDDGEAELLKALPIDASSYLDDAFVDGALHLYVIALVLPDGTESNLSEPVSVRW